MKKLLPLLLVFFAPLLSVAQQTDTTTHTRVGDPAPTFDFYLNKTKTANLADYKGKIVVLDFWATWCPPCAWNCHGYKKKFGKSIRITQNSPFSLLTGLKDGIKRCLLKNKTIIPSRWFPIRTGKYMAFTPRNIFRV
jgi:hypothetical protein